jgi:hypothetical protein
VKNIVNEGFSALQPSFTTFFTSVNIVRFRAVLYGCETWSLTVREEHMLRVFENRVLRRIFGPKRKEGSGGNYIIRNLMICTAHPILCGW